MVLEDKLSPKLVSIIRTKNKIEKNKTTNGVKLTPSKYNVILKLLVEFDC
jgi:hypothetical protein